MKSEFLPKDDILKYFETHISEQDLIWNNLRLVYRKNEYLRTIYEANSEI